MTTYIRIVLVLLIVGIAISARHKGRSFPFKGILWFVGISFVVIFIFRGCNRLAEKWTAPPNTTKPTASYHEKMVSPTRTRKLYLFSNFPNEIIKVEIGNGEVDFYPKGGEIIIITSKGEEVKDSPGTIRPRRPFPEGVYNIKKSNPGAIGVEIWN